MTTDAGTWAIDARDLTKTFGTETVVRGGTLQVPSGTIFAFLGPNGSGKSPTVKLLTGPLAPTAGEARVCGRVVSVEDVRLRREIGVLPEDDALFPDLTIWEHLELCGRLYGIDRREADSRAIQLLRHLDLEHGRTTLVDKASTGMRKKCALAMALLHNPRVLFLDEPFEGIDPGSSRNIKDLLLGLVERFAIIVKGEVVCCQTVSELARAGTTLERLYLGYAGKPDAGDLAWLGHR